MSCPKYKLSMKNKNMKKIYIHKIHLILCFTSVLCFGLPINAQQNAKNGAADNNKKAWEMRKHVAWYVKGMKGAAKFRAQINQVESYEELEELLKMLIK